jgi:hypothetical protein
MCEITHCHPTALQHNVQRTARQGVDDPLQDVLGQSHGLLQHGERDGRAAHAAGTRLYGDTSTHTLVRVVKTSECVRYGCYQATTSHCCGRYLVSQRLEAEILKDTGHRSSPVCPVSTKSKCSRGDNRECNSTLSLLNASMTMACSVVTCSSNTFLPPKVPFTLHWPRL